MLRSKYSRKPVANSQKRKLWVSLIVLMHQYVLLLALVQAQKGPTAEGQRARPDCPAGRTPVSPPPPRPWWGRPLTLTLGNLLPDLQGLARRAGVGWGGVGVAPGAPPAPGGRAAHASRGGPSASAGCRG